MCHTKTADLAGECRRAEILVVAAGKAGVVTKDFVAPGQTVVDVGSVTTAVLASHVIEAAERCAG
jgi:5,10-methylene-tetrahydrofolate dehydrogenase/methenyl tetrahydrofolate cyclohydrolase